MLAAHLRGRYMLPIDYVDDCRRCHPLTVEVANIQVDLPHDVPAVVNAHVDRVATERGQGSDWQANVAMHLYAESGVCGSCHTIESLPSGPSITPPAIKEGDIDDLPATAGDRARQCRSHRGRLPAGRQL